MKPEFRSRRLFGITRAKGKMFEFGIDLSAHIEIPESDDPEALFLLTVGTLGDAAAAINSGDFELLNESRSDLEFSASFFDAFLSAKLREDLDPQVLLLASAAYFLARRPGSSLVLARSLRDQLKHPCEVLLTWVLKASWADSPDVPSESFGSNLTLFGKLIADHFNEGSSVTEINNLAEGLRRNAYDASDAYELLLVDLICSVTRMRLASSSWIVLPKFSGVTAAAWRPVIAKPGFPKELWPSQIRLGQHHLFLGASGVIQMPTSAGKTRSLEMVIRSAFLANRAALAVVVAPFRALCHEIATTLKIAFADDDVAVNELSDVLQRDYAHAFDIGADSAQSKGVLILTPEKLLLVLRQMPSLIERIGVVIYDEGHQFDSGSRGVTYELLLTEIKSLLQASAQTILVSAVINNAEAIGTWLIGEEAPVVDGAGVLPTSRSVAFASWAEQLGQLIFFESDDYSKYDYFVPRVIQQRELSRRGNEKKKRYFPVKSDARDIGLFLGLQLASRGAVAIFCGRKDSAASVARRAVEIYERDYELPAPAASSSAEEVEAIRSLAAAHFGEESDECRAANLGVFVHHGNTPEGIRLSVEYAMQRGRIRFVACTSTLAQGVNLPIRYLIVSTVYQAGERIKVRDFQNLMGRAGRAGMHTEGLIIFADAETYDRRRANPWKFDVSVNLLDPRNSEDVTSSLLSIVGPLQGTFAHIPIPIPILTELLFDDLENGKWVTDFVHDHRRAGFNQEAIHSELRRRKSLLLSLESYLMANRGVDDFKSFREETETLATRTLAYALGSDEEREALLYIFRATADFVEELAPSYEKQKIYAKTLLGVADAVAVDRWVEENIEKILECRSPDRILETVWPLFSRITVNMFFSDVRPPELSGDLAREWLRGATYGAIFDLSTSAGGSRPWGKQRRALNNEAISSFLENVLGFDCVLIVGAVLQFMDAYEVPGEVKSAFELFQKQLKYGLPDSLSISIYEFGFADRVIAQRIRDELALRGYPMGFFSLGLISRGLLREVVAGFPSYFKTVVASREARG